MDVGLVVSVGVEVLVDVEHHEEAFVVRAARGVRCGGDGCEVQEVVRVRRRVVGHLRRRQRCLDDRCVPARRIGGAGVDDRHCALVLGAEVLGDDQVLRVGEQRHLVGREAPALLGR
jgi:hypothetical protein